MARKKQDIALQAEIETQEEWEEMLAKEGLTVVDIYQEWSGPCKAMVSNFRRLKNELGDDLLRFAVAKCDTIDSLEFYRGTCKPCFLYYAGGVLVAVVRGCNSPLLLKTVTEQLALEHKVLEGNAERKEIRDPLLAAMASKEKQEEEEEEEEEAAMESRTQSAKSKKGTEEEDVEITEQRKDVTMAIIKPDLVADGKVEEVLQKLKEAGIEILDHIERTMTEEEAREFYAHRKEEEYFEGLIQFMTSGESHFLVLSKGETGEGIVEEWRELLGPANVEEAKEQAPDSFRAQYGKESYVNALHGSDSKDSAMKELAFFFPGFAAPKLPGKGKKPNVERTLALIRPDAMVEKKDEILQKVKEAGFTIAMTKELQLTKEQAEDFYKEHQSQEYFEELTTRMSSGPLLALALARQDAVSGWREMLGPAAVDEAKEKAPESLRAQYSVEGVPINTLHGSDSANQAEKELEYFFPMQQTVAAIKPDAMNSKDEIMNKIKEAGFHIAARKETDLTKEIAEQFYKDHQGKEYFGDLVDHMTSGPTLFMVLSREDAVDGWRSIIGPTDPSQAKDNAPDSLRAQFGADIRQNAVHGSSNPEHAQDSIKLVFGELEFNKDGTLVVKREGEETQEEQQEQPSQETTQAQEGETEGEKPAESEQQEAQEGQEQKQEDSQETQEEQKEDEGEKAETGEEQAAPEGGQTEEGAQEQPEGEPKSEEQTQEQPGEQQQNTESGEGEQAGEQETTLTAQESQEEQKPAEGADGQETTQEETKPETSEDKGENEAQAQESAEEKTQEQQPTESEEQKPAETEGAEQKPAETEGDEQKPADSEDQKPTESEEQKTGDEEQKTGDEGEKPAEGQEKTEEQEKKPDES